MVYCRKDEQIGFVFYDISILEFYVGCFKDPKTNVGEFRTLVQTLKPVEVVTLYSENHKELVKIMKNMQQRPILTYLTQDKLPDVHTTNNLAQNYMQKNGSGTALYPDGLEAMFLRFFDHHEDEVQLQAIGLAFKYMEDMMMAEVTIPFASFRPYHGDNEYSFLNTNTNMVLDSSTQESLEIFNVQAEDEDDEKMQCKSLVDLLDQTATPFGRRLLRKWLSAPLTDVHQIQLRQ